MAPGVTEAEKRYIPRLGRSTSAHRRWLLIPSLEKQHLCESSAELVSLAPSPAARHKGGCDAGLHPIAFHSREKVGRGRMHPQRRPERPVPDAWGGSGALPECQAPEKPRAGPDEGPRLPRVARLREPSPRPAPTHRSRSPAPPSPGAGVPAAAACPRGPVRRGDRVPGSGRARG